LSLQNLEHIHFALRHREISLIGDFALTEDRWRDQAFMRDLTLRRLKFRSRARRHSILVSTTTWHESLSVVRRRLTRQHLDRILHALLDAIHALQDPLLVTKLTRQD
jgi:hypothetical protein